MHFILVEALFVFTSDGDSDNRSGPGEGKPTLCPLFFYAILYFFFKHLFTRFLYTPLFFESVNDGKYFGPGPRPQFQARRVTAYLVSPPLVPF